MKNSITTFAVITALLAGFSLQAQTTKTSQNSQTKKESSVNKSSSNANGQKKSTVNKSSSNTTKKNSTTKTKTSQSPAMKVPNNAQNDSLRNQDINRYNNDNGKPGSTDSYPYGRPLIDTTTNMKKDNKVHDNIKRDTI